MQIRTHSKATLRCQHHDILGRTVIQDIANARRQHQLIQERVVCNVSVSAWNTRELDAFGVDEVLDYGGIRGSYDKRGIDFACNQFFSGYLRRIARYFSNNAVNS